MSLYYFHIEDGTPHGDPEEVELPDLAAARSRAESWFSTLLGAGKSALRDGDIRQVRVTDETGHVCLSLELSAAGVSTQGVHAYRLRAEHAFPE